MRLFSLEIQPTPASYKWYTSTRLQVVHITRPRVVHITRLWVAHHGRLLTLGCTVFYLGNYREVADRVCEVAAAHNAQIRQRRYEALSARIVQAIEEAKRDGNLSALEINRRLGLSHERLRRWYPELYTMVQQAVREYRAQMRAARVEARCAQINEAAARLVAQGISLTHVMILKETGLSNGSAKNDPEVEALLRQWVRCYTPGGG